MLFCGTGHLTYVLNKISSYKNFNVCMYEVVEGNESLFPISPSFLSSSVCSLRKRDANEWNSLTADMSVPLCSNERWIPSKLLPRFNTS